MAGTRGPVLEITIPASGDLSADQYRCVSINSSGSAVNAPGGTASSGTPIIGIQTNKPGAAGRGTRITISGVEKLECAAAWAPGDAITALSGAAGRGSPISVGGLNSGTGWIVGIAVTSTGASGDIGEVMVLPQYFAHA